MLRRLLRSCDIGKLVKIKTGYYSGCLGIIIKYVPKFKSHFKVLPEGYMVYIEDETRLPKSLHFYEEKDLEF